MVTAVARPISVPPLAVCVIESALGPIVITARDDGVVGVSAPGARVERSLRELAPGLRPAAPSGVLREASEQLQAYARGELQEFTLPLVFPDSPLRPFWDACLRIPYGQVCSYGELAAAAGRAGEARAAGAAMATNPLAVVVPCHRVIDSMGGLHGYGGGLYHKRDLLRLEGALPRAASELPDWVERRHRGVERPVVAVRSTRIYCLPDCRTGARLNLETHVPESFASGGDAEAAGFRPCRICRPDRPQGRLIA